MVIGTGTDYQCGHKHLLTVDGENSSALQSIIRKDPEFQQQNPQLYHSCSDVAIHDKFSQLLLICPHHYIYLHKNNTTIIFVFSTIKDCWPSDCKCQLISRSFVRGPVKTNTILYT